MKKIVLSVGVLVFAFGGLVIGYVSQSNPHTPNVNNSYQSLLVTPLVVNAEEEEGEDPTYECFVFDHWALDPMCESYPIGQKTCTLWDKLSHSRECDMRQWHEPIYVSQSFNEPCTHGIFNFPPQYEAEYQACSTGEKMTEIDDEGPSGKIKVSRSA